MGWEAGWAARDHPGAMQKTVSALACLGTGALIAAALPPWGWWPLAFVGVALFDRLIADRPRWARFRRGMAVGVGLYVPSLAWMTEMTVPGYAIATVAYAALVGVAALAVPASAPGRWLALPGAIALTELLRWSWPFGGVPLSSLAVGQVAGPLAPVLRVGGALLLVEVTVVAGIGLAALLRRRWLAGGAALAVVAVAVAGAAVAPQGRQVDTLRVALVQGGGPQGTRAWNTDERKVFERHLEASEEIDTPVDLVVWPEDVVDVDRLAGSEEGDELAALARRLDTTLVAGIVEDAGDEHFLNFSAAFGPDGEIVDRYEKVHRVPFGEYVPLRGLLERFSGGSLTSPRRGHRAGAGDARHPGRAAERRHLVGDLLRRPGARGGRGRCRPGAQPDQRVVVLGNAGPDPAGRLVADAGDRERPVAAAGGADRVQRRHRARRHGRAAVGGVGAAGAPRDRRRPRGHDAVHPVGPRPRARPSRSRGWRRGGRWRPGRAGAATRRGWRRPRRSRRQRRPAVTGLPRGGPRKPAGHRFHPSPRRTDHGARLFGDISRSTWPGGFRGPAWACYVSVSEASWGGEC